MKYVVTGSLGHISKPLVEKLVSAGHDVKVITSDSGKGAAISNLGATPEVGSVSDVEFLRKAFAGADAVYTMVPPFFGAADWKAYIRGIGQNYSGAIRHAGIRYVVNLSSVGADQPDGCGPVSGLYGVEQALNGLSDTHVLHLRPGYFYYNFFGNLDMIRNAGIIGGNYGEGSKMVLVHTNDIANVAADALLNLGFNGKSVKYISGDEKTTNEIAEAFGNALGLPGLKWVNFSDEQTLEGLKGAGLPEEIAANYMEMGRAIRDGRLLADYFRNVQSPQGTITLDDFAREFAAAYTRRA